MHHFQEPVRDVVAHTQRIENLLSGRTEPGLDEAFAIVREGAMRMRDLARGLNRYAELAEHEPEIGTVDLGEVVDDTLASLAADVEAESAQVLVDELPRVEADREDLSFVFAELLGNALRFRDEAPPRVEIRAEPRDDTWVVSLTDNGIGIDPAYHERVFRPFQRAHSYDERPGVGLGLTIARELVEECGGSMWVDSEEGEGATFFVALPAALGDGRLDAKTVDAKAPLLAPPDDQDLLFSE